MPLVAASVSCGTCCLGMSYGPAALQPRCAAAISAAAVADRRPSWTYLSPLSSPPVPCVAGRAMVCVLGVGGWSAGSPPFVSRGWCFVCPRLHFGASPLSACTHYLYDGGGRGVCWDAEALPAIVSLFTCVRLSPFPPGLASPPPLCLPPSPLSLLACALLPRVRRCGACLQVCVVPQFTPLTPVGWGIAGEGCGWWAFASRSPHSLYDYEAWGRDSPPERTGREGPANPGGSPFACRARVAAEEHAVAVPCDATPSLAHRWCRVRKGWIGRGVMMACRSGLRLPPCCRWHWVCKGS